METLQLNEYVQAALRTESHTPGIVYQRLAENANVRAEMNVAFGQFIYAAQRLDKIKKALYYGKPTEFDAPVDKMPMPSSFSILETDGKMSRMFHAVLGICTEAGEMLEAMDKVLYEGKELDVDNIFEEMGDGMWYFAIGCDSMGFDPETVIGRNIAKLKARYPDKFTTENALNRDLDKEKQALSGK